MNFYIPPKVNLVTGPNGGHKIDRQFCPATQHAFFLSKEGNHLYVLKEYHLTTFHQKWGFVNPTEWHKTKAEAAAGEPNSINRSFTAPSAELSILVAMMYGNEVRIAQREGDMINYCLSKTKSNCSPVCGHDRKPNPTTNEGEPTVTSKLKTFIVPTARQHELRPDQYIEGSMQAFYINGSKELVVLRYVTFLEKWAFVKVNNLVGSRQLLGLAWEADTPDLCIFNAVSHGFDVFCLPDIDDVFKYYYLNSVEQDPVKPVCKQQPIVWNMDDMNALNKCIEERWLPLSKKNTDHDLEVLPECALCTLAKRRGDRIAEDGCDHCIIKHDTGRGWCKGTPFHGWFCASFENQMKEAQAELKYLKELRIRLLSQECED